MALQLPVSVNVDAFTARSGNYWRIANIRDDRSRESPSTIVFLELWESAATRADPACMPISMANVIVQGGIDLDALRASGMDIYGFMYTWIKANDARFAGALDV